MSLIYILRHGHAERMANSDQARQLTDLGRQEARAAGEHFKAELMMLSNQQALLKQEALLNQKEARQRESVAPLSNVIDDKVLNDLLIVASPYVRTQQTAEIVREMIGFNQPLVTCDEVTPDRSPVDAAQKLDQIITNSSASNLLVVSHLPMVSELINILVWGEYGQRVAMGTAYLTKLDTEVIAKGMAELRWTKAPIEAKRAAGE